LREREGLQIYWLYRQITIYNNVVWNVLTVRSVASVLHKEIPVHYSFKIELTNPKQTITPYTLIKYTL